MAIKIEKQKLWLFTRDYIVIALSIALYAFGFNCFIATSPEKVVVGGLTGLSQVVDLLSFGLIGCHVPYAVTICVVNVILLAMALKSVGKTFVVRTVYGVACMTFFMALFQPMFHHEPVPNQAPVNIIIGAIISGFAIGTVFNHNGSTGGTDIVAAIAAKHSNVTIGRSMLYFDMGVIGSSVVVKFFFDPNFSFDSAVPPLVYGLITLFIVPLMADMVINTNRQAIQFTIFSHKWEEIATAINNEAHRGCTVLNGMGWYSKQPVKVLMVMCRKIESVTIFRIVKSIDRDAFITQAQVNGVYGKGFDQLKMRMKATAPDPHPELGHPTSGDKHAVRRSNEEE